MDLSVILSGQLLASVLVLASLYALVAIGLNLVYGTMRLLNVAHGELVMLGGYIAYWGFAQWGISPLISALFAMGVAAAAGALIYIAVIRRLFRSRFQARVEANSLQRVQPCTLSERIARAACRPGSESGERGMSVPGSTRG